MAIHFEDENELYGVQADVVWNSIETNPLLARKTSAMLNQKLETKNKRIISAINELKSATLAADVSVVGALTHVNNVVGDVSVPEVQGKLDNLGGTVIEATHVLSQRIEDAIAEAKRYADEKVSDVNITVIDGGEF